MTITTDPNSGAELIERIKNEKIDVFLLFQVLKKTLGLKKTEVFFDDYFALKRAAIEYWKDVEDEDKIN